MDIKQTIEQDLKTALLTGDKAKVSVLRGLKNSILYAEVAANKRDNGLSNVEILDVLGKEVKKRQESADLYKQGGSQEKAQIEQSEKEIIEQYLPKQLSDEELRSITEEVIKSFGTVTKQQMGQVIGKVKSQVGATADGARIAKIVGESL